MRLISVTEKSTHLTAVVNPRRYFVAGINEETDGLFASFLLKNLKTWTKPPSMRYGFGGLIRWLLGSVKVWSEFAFNGCMTLLA